MYSETELPRLTRKQAEALSHLVLGKTNLKIAEEMKIKNRTVESHVSELLSKFGVKSRLALVVAHHNETLKYHVENLTASKRDGK
jgi:DNA-binding NarL/FixJ family response regulator